MRFYDMTADEAYARDEAEAEDETEAFELALARDEDEAI